jgi:hypothetical protein
MKKQTLNEIRRMQKIAGLLREDLDAPKSDSYEDTIAQLDDMYPDPSQYQDFVNAFKKELMHLPEPVKKEWIAKFKANFGS